MPEVESEPGPDSKPAPRLGSYLLVQSLGSGGMSNVFRAVHEETGSVVAVKVLPRTLAKNATLLQRFMREAKSAEAMDHPNIVAIYDRGFDQGRHYLVLEYVEGRDMHDRVRLNGPLKPEDAVSFVREVAEGLRYAAAQGMIHRDVKPANILVTPDGTAKLTDFGISRLAGSAPLTKTGQVIGTAQYLSPEVVSGQSATASSDIYALGVVGHEMLSGHPPFRGETLLATAIAHLNQPPPPLPDSVPVGIRTVISAALAKSPADRPATAAAMAQALGMPDATSGAQSCDSGAAADRTQVLPFLAVGTRGAATQVSSTQSTSGKWPETADRRSRLHPAWLLGAASALVIGVLAAFALPGGGAPTPVDTTTTSPRTAQTKAAPVSAGTPTQIASPEEGSSRTDLRERAKARARAHDNEKDGKP